MYSFYVCPGCGSTLEPLPRVRESCPVFECVKCGLVILWSNVQIVEHFDSGEEQLPLFDLPKDRLNFL